MQSYISQPCSRKDIRLLALEVRKTLRLENVVYFPIVQLLELMYELFPNYHFEVVEDCEFSHDLHAETDVESHAIRIKQSVYDGACMGKGRDRMTIAHEIGHYLLLCICGFKFQRNYASVSIPVYRDPEWQASCFAGELLVAAHLVKGMTPDEISRMCGVSMPAAKKQWGEL